MSINHFSTATDMLAALRKKEISAVELAEMHIMRIEQHDGTLNAIAVQTFERARAAAQTADKRLAAGDTEPLLGLPMTLKESTLVAGLPQTAGIPDFKGYTPGVDGVVATSVFEAGAGLLGKTNIPVALGDWQADSPVYGRTNNPWDLNRTPGGSTGGGGAALAAGLTPLEVGSDIGGSVRVPAAYCGCYGHRPSETAVPRSGAFPIADLPNPAFLMGVQGPLARSAQDLELLFDVIAGPDIGESVAWRLQLPQPRAESLQDFRVAVMPSILDVHCSSQMSAKLDELVSLLQREGATVAQASPDINMTDYFHDYARMLNVMVTQGQGREERVAAAEAIRAVGDDLAMAQAEGLDMDANAYLALVNRRQAACMAWQQFFTQWDLVIAPMTLDSAFEHQIGDFESRALTVDNVELPYFANIMFPMLAIFTGLPSTAFPAGLDSQGLPLGLQAIGPYLEDRTPLKFAQLVEQAWGGFQAPPGF
jgi:amidase